MKSNQKVKYISTTALSKELKLGVKEVFKILLDHKLIDRANENWVLTQKGKEAGGTVKKHPKAGEYIAWIETIKTDPIFLIKEEKLINATALSNHFRISRFKMNPILSELGFLEKGVKGWKLTNLGKTVGGKQFEHEKTGVPYVNWPETILTNKRLVETMEELQGKEKEKENSETKTLEFRGKFEAKHRTADGHYVRSRAEMLIDNWLYMSEIVHAYERKLPVEEDVYTDFYLPIGKVYIEYWGLENDPKYAERKQQKLKVYNKYGFNLIELHDADIQNLDDILPKKLLKFGIQAY
ncbi:glycerol kinase [Halobacillus sp. Marseille-P3879]|uniref:glycerol kinase n=1 Tax=Halobacillus sp. Marseille-P3879 TaxID=2045014 RepID=UPI000C7CA19C|nr:glycerol kinase [Halobacillus sp. Marseille-P3879]